MNTVPRTHHRQLLAAAVVASFLMLAFGLGYRAAAAWIEGPVDASPIPPEAVEGFPMQIGRWAGEERPLDPNIVEATDTDAHISRHYSRAGGLETVSLWVACEIRTRDLMPHRPEVCYVGNGWTLQEREAVDLPIERGEPLPCSILRFSRGMLDMRDTVVLYYYIADGQYCRDVSEWRYSLKGIGYVAQVQVITSVLPGQTVDAAERLVSSFAADSAPAIAALFEDAGDARDLDGAGESAKGER